LPFRLDSELLDSTRGLAVQTLLPRVDLQQEIVNEPNYIVRIICITNKNVHVVVGVKDSVGGFEFDGLVGHELEGKVLLPSKRINHVWCI